ncbi:T9SS type A sorting domain-containing protein [Bacteroidota bacterium]
MKRNLLKLLMMLVLIAGGNALFAQWTQYNCDALPENDATMNVKTEVTLVNGTSEIIVDPDDATNNFWKYNINLDEGDGVKYSWYPSYWDLSGTDNVSVPAPSTIAVKFKWVDTTTVFGPRIELREVNKVNATPIKKKGKFLIEINDWTLDSLFSLPETFDPTEWHVLRLTSNGADWKVYIDEDPTEFATGTQGKATGKHLALFSAYGSSGKSEIIIDWMGYIEDGANSPSDFPLPEGIFTPPADNTSVNNLNASELISVYPNPVNDMLSVSIGNDMLNSRYEMIDITGKVVKRGLLSKQVNQVDVSDFNSGMYFVKMISGKKVLSESFIVK